MISAKLPPDAVLFSLVECQESGGYDAYVQMGDYVRYLKVIPVVCFIKEDAKSGDAPCCRFGGKNCKGRVPRLCLTPMKDLDNPMHDCKWIRALDSESIYKMAAQEGETREQKMEIKKHRDALKATSTHFCDNALFRAFGYNPLGVTLATHTDMVHLFESGTIPRVLLSLVQSMSNSVQGQVDDLIEELFLTHCSSCSSEFLRMMFRNGATNLTMLSSHHWPGMDFAFLLVILSDKGKEITKDCFQKEDAPEPDFDWKTAPGMDYNIVYQLPVLAKVNLQSDNESNDSSHSSFSTSDDDDLTDVEVNNEGVTILPPQEFSDDEIIPSPKKKDEKKPVKMTFSRRQMVSLLEELLSFHSRGTSTVKLPLDLTMRMATPMISSCCCIQ
jgi:hypothetical protein